MMMFVLDRVENFMAKGENAAYQQKCCLPAFSPFITMFSKAFLSKVIESRDCVGKS